MKAYILNYFYYWRNMISDHMNAKNLTRTDTLDNWTYNNAFIMKCIDIHDLYN